MIKYLSGTSLSHCKDTLWCIVHFIAIQRSNCKGQIPAFIYERYIMRAKASKIVRQLFKKRLKQVLPQFKDVKCKESSGCREYWWQIADDLFLGIDLVIAKEDVFCVYIGWTKDYTVQGMLPYILVDRKLQNENNYANSLAFNPQLGLTFFDWDVVPNGYEERYRYEKLGITHLPNRMAFKVWNTMFDNTIKKLKANKWIIPDAETARNYDLILWKAPIEEFLPRIPLLVDDAIYTIISYTIPFFKKVLQSFGHEISINVPEALFNEIFEAGNKLYAKDERKNPFTELMHWANVGSVSWCNETLKSKPQIDERDRFGCTSLMYASASKYCMWELPTGEFRKSEQDHDKVMKLLVENGADVNAYDFDGETSLMKAAAGGYAEGIEMLVKAGAALNTQDIKGRTAIIWAAIKNQLESVSVLIKAGGDKLIKDHTNKTALQWAQELNNLEVVQLLK